MSKLSGRYTLEELIVKELEGGKPLIENMLYERDNNLTVGMEKTNKSTFWLQACCALTSGEPFLNEFDIPRAIDCVILQAEGKLASTKQNAIRMKNVIPCDKSKLSILYYPNIPLNTIEGLSQIKSDIDAWRRPELIVIDPLYQSMQGDISSQQDSSSMTANLRDLSEYYHTAIVLIHHAHRPRRSESGQLMDEGDDSVFGSFVWKACPDSVFLIERVRGHRNNRKFSCNTQRMGNVVEQLDLVLIEPEPFYLQIREGQPLDSIIESKMGYASFTILDMISMTSGRSRQHISNSLARLIHAKKVKILNVGKKPIIYQKITT